MTTALPLQRKKPHVVRKWLADPLAIIGLIIFLGFVGMALIAPLLSPYDPSLPDLRARLVPPGSPGHLLGTDQLGRDVLSRLIYGSRVTLIVGFGGVLLTAIIGVVLGLMAGYLGGRVEAFIMRLVDTLIAIPSILLYLTAIGVFGPSLTMLIVVIGLINWTTFARVVRGEVLAMKQREFVEAAHALGQSDVLITLKHILPNILSSVIVVATLNVATIVILEATLSFLGFGVQPPTVTWGGMLSEGRNYVASAWWLATLPGMAISLLSLSLIFLGDRLRDVLDPRLKT
ncbi:ABC transporter permease [Deinococcus sp. QL22]|uniref:ABC transporter permease n=1 Tax=Deinococcus sp. QL22 TaxID=2939437 RepID=UPI002017EFE9|nr:ABC transporter permease [Deinococcus sp. QL22]UQN08217.1 ABC transporter permease [Deinococcus sp. QL22]